MFIYLQYSGLATQWTESGWSGLESNQRGSVIELILQFRFQVSRLTILRKIQLQYCQQKGSLNVRELS